MRAASRRRSSGVSTSDGLGQQLDGEPQLAAAVEGRGEDLVGAPGDLREQPRRHGSGAQGDQIVAAVLGGAQHHVGAGLDRLEGAVHHLHGERRVIAPQRRHRAGLRAAPASARYSRPPRSLPSWRSPGHGPSRNRLPRFERPGDPQLELPLPQPVEQILQERRMQRRRLRGGKIPDQTGLHPPLPGRLGEQEETAGEGEADTGRDCI